MRILLCILAVTILLISVSACATGGKTVVGNATGGTIVVGANADQLNAIFGNLAKLIGSSTLKEAASDVEEDETVSEETVQLLRQIASDKDQADEVRMEARRALKLIGQR